MKDGEEAAAWEPAEKASEAEAAALHRGSRSRSGLGILETERKLVGLELLELGEWIEMAVESGAGSPIMEVPGGHGRA